MLLIFLLFYELWIVETKFRKSNLYIYVDLMADLIRLQSRQQVEIPFPFQFKTVRVKCVRFKLN